MAAEEIIETEGKITSVLAGTMFRVELANKHLVLATICGKQVRIEMEGKETDLDKTIIEAIKDPLTHIVRNSVDHGIEAPEVRLRAGKSAEGLIRLRAFHEGGQINIEIADDGAGINPEVVRAKAVAKGVITAEQAARLSEREAIALVFLPGAPEIRRLERNLGDGRFEAVGQRHLAASGCGDGGAGCGCLGFMTVHDVNQQ